MGDHQQGRWRRKAGRRIGPRKIDGPSRRAQGRADWRRYVGRAVAGEPIRSGQKGGRYAQAERRPRGQREPGTKMTDRDDRIREIAFSVARGRVPRRPGRAPLARRSSHPRVPRTQAHRRRASRRAGGRIPERPWRSGHARDVADSSAARRPFRKESVTLSLAISFLFLPTP